MAVDTILFLDDEIHITKTAVSIFGVSSTDAGYHKDNVRDTNYATAWKPINSAADEYTEVDGGSVGWLGTASTELVHLVVAYDARGANQTLLKLASDAGDASGGTFLEIKATLTVNATRPTVDYVTFTRPASGKRYYRLWQFNTDRGGGTVPVKIHAWSMFRTTDQYNINTGFTADAIGPGGLALRSKVARLETAGGVVFTNRYGSTDQEIELNFQKATLSLWSGLRDKLFALDNDNRAFYMQYEGIRGDAKANFAMVRQRGGYWNAQRRVADLYDTDLPVVTEPWH